MTTLLPRRWPLIVAVAALLATMIPAASPALADTGAEGEFVSLLNQERAAAGLAAAEVASDLTAVARRHSERMARDAELHHNPNLGSDVSGWQKVGENVGRGPSASAIHQGFMNSPSHRDNILDADWTEVGVGVVVRDGQVWVTEVFRLPSGATGTPAPAPAPTPASASDPTPTPDPTPTSASSGGSADASTDTGAAAGAPDAQEPAPAGPHHEVTERPTGLDRGLLALARLEASEQDSTISAALN